MLVHMNACICLLHVLPQGHTSLFLLVLAGKQLWSTSHTLTSPLSVMYMLIIRRRRESRERDENGERGGGRGRWKEGKGAKGGRGEGRREGRREGVREEGRRGEWEVEGGWKGEGRDGVREEGRGLLLA